MEITELLAFAQKNKASDLHLVGGKEPMVRIDGGLKPIKTGDLSADTVKNMLYSVMTEEQRSEYESEKELDFAIAFGAESRFRVNAYTTTTGMAAAFRNNLVGKSGARVKVDGKGGVVVETDMTDIGTGSGSSCTSNGSEVLILDGETMNLCKSKKVRTLVENAHTWHTGRRYVVDAIAYREALPETDPERAKLPALRDQLAAGDAAKPKEIAAVDYEIPQIPCLTVAEVLVTRTEEE